MVPNYILTYSLNIISLPPKFSYLNYLWDIMGIGKITKIIVIDVIEKIVVKKKREKTDLPSQV